MSLVQIVKRTGRIDRVKPEHAPPVVELEIGDNQRVISIDLHEVVFGDLDRKTRDWRWTAYVETRL